MAISKLKITFFEDLIVGSTVFFNIVDIPTSGTTPTTFTWVATRTTANEVEITAPIPPGYIPGENSANDFVTAFLIDYPTYPVEIFGNNQVVITAPDENTSFSGGLAMYSTMVVANVDFDVSRNNGITVDGLGSNGYLINNEIWINLAMPEAVVCYSITFRNLSNGKVSRPFVTYAFNNEINVNIAPIIKSMFDYTNVKNDNVFKISILADNGITNAFQKTFIRGGNRTNDINQNLTAGTILRPSIKLPIWDGFETNEYYLDSGFVIRQRIFNDIDPLLKDFKRVKGCNNVYFKFLNQQGGYSNWLFESNSTRETNTNLGSFIRTNVLDDFGNTSSSTLDVYSKVPKEYIELIKDLIVSPEIYAFINSTYVRIYSAKNSIEKDDIKRAYSVKLKFDFEYRFNPSLLW